MKIQNNFQTTHKRNFNPLFTSNTREVVIKETGKYYQNTTHFFRNDLKWHHFTNELIKKYENTNKVNIYCYGCSDGAEPFSLAMLLLDKFGLKKAQKFFPIIAKDIDEKILENPKNGILKLSDLDVSCMNSFLKENHKKYVEYSNNYRHIPELEAELCDGKIKPILKHAVIFDKANALEDIENIKTNNNVIMCRNFWCYLDETESNTLATKISTKKDGNSLCITGDLDSSSRLLLSKGLKVNYELEGDIPLWRRPQYFSL